MRTGKSDIGGIVDLSLILPRIATSRKLFLTLNPPHPISDAAFVDVAKSPSQSSLA